VSVVYRRSAANVEPTLVGSAAPALVLVVEDDPHIRRFLRASFAASGYRYAEAGTGEDGLAEAARRRPDIVILDLALPDMDGLEVLRGLRAWTRTPVIVLSARGREPDKIAALDGGADDYVTKPFGVGELLARMRVALRRGVPEGGDTGEAIFTVGELRVDLARRLVTVAEREVHLTPIEYRLLVMFVRHAGKVITHRQLLTEVWGPDCVDESHYVRVYTAQLRRKLEADPARPQYLLTEPGVGYRLVES
jgi:two-component system KDP operon response regulator KdpE